MSIVSHELLGSNPNGTRLDVTYKFTDHLGKEYVYHKLVPVGFDTEADMLSMIPDIEAGIESTEIAAAIAEAEEHRYIFSSPDHQTQPDFDRRFLGTAMMEDDIVKMWNIYDDFFRDFENRGGNNKPQRAAYLGVDSGTYDLIDKRFNDMAGITSLVNDEKGRVWDELPDGYW